MQEAEKPFIQQIHDLRLIPASPLNRIRCVKFTSGYQNAELKRLAFLRRRLTDAMFSNARSASLLIDTRPVSLRENSRLIKSAFFKCRQTNATISNAKSTSLLSRGMRPASQSQNVKSRLFYRTLTPHLWTLRP